MSENREDRRNPSRSDGQGGEARPNVVLITLDAGRYDLLAQNLDSLPSLKALAERSVFFENAFSVGPSTMFAFPAIIGGVYPYHFGQGIDQSVRAVDEVLKGSGYNTGFIIEWNPLLSPRFGYGVRADFQLCRFGMAEGGVAQPASSDPAESSREAALWRFIDRPYPLRGVVRRLRPLWRRNEASKVLGSRFLAMLGFARSYARGKSPKIDKVRHDHDLFRQNVLTFVNERFKAPQFLWIHTTVNHLPYVTPSPGSEFGARQTNYLNARGLSMFVNRGICGQLKRLYVESLRVADDLVGDVIRALSARGLLDNSIIIVTSDHGEEFMEEGTFFHGAESSSDILLHVPLIISHGGVLKQMNVQAPVSTIDIPPTICDLAGVEMADSFRGVSLKPAMQGRRPEPVTSQHGWSRALFSEGWIPEGMLERSPGGESYERIFTVRKGNYRLKVAEVDKGKGTIEEKLELMDWVTGRRLDLKSHNDVVEELRHLVRQHVYEEGVVARNLKRKSERQHIKDALARARRKPPGADRKEV